MRRNAKQIYDSLKKQVGVTTNEELAEFLGIKYYTLISQLRNNTVNYEMIIEKFPGLSLDYLIRGAEYSAHDELNALVDKLRDELAEKNVIISALTKQIKEQNHNSQ